MGTLAWGLFRITQTPLLLLLLSLSLSYPASSLPHRSTYTDRELSWMHNRPPEASYLLPRRNRDLGVLYMGATERMRLVVHKMMAGAVRIPKESTNALPGVSGPGQCGERTGTSHPASS